MASVPRLIVTAEQQDDSSRPRQPLGSIDITASLASLLARSPGRLEHWLEKPSVRIADIRNDLPEHVRELAFRGELCLPDFAPRLQEWASGLGGPSGIVRAARILEEQATAEFRLKRRQEELGRVLKAVWTTGQQCEMVYSESFQADYAADPETGLSSWGWDSFVKEHPRPDADFDSAEYQAWSALYEAWVRREAPPYAYATQPRPWEGISAESIRQDLADEGTFDLAQLIESSLEDHYEDAYESVVDEDGLWTFIQAWEQQPRDGSPRDMELETFLAAWNARQTIVSYEWDKGTLVPMFPDATHAEAIAWCEQAVRDARSRLEITADAWAMPQAVEETEAAAVSMAL